MSTLCKILFVLILMLTASCGNDGLIHRKKKVNKETTSCVEGKSAYTFQKRNYTGKEGEILNLHQSIVAIDAAISDGRLITKEQKKNKFGSFYIYSDKKKIKKIRSEIYIRNLRLASIKHEVFFLDSCTTIAKMTKYAYRSQRVNTVYYFSFYGEQLIGCIMVRKHAIFTKKDKWITISNDKIATDWSKRIYNNLIEPYRDY